MLTEGLKDWKKKKKKKKSLKINAQETSMVQQINKVEVAHNDVF